MVSKVWSISVNWLFSDLIEVEVDIHNWITSFTIVWLPDTWVQESKERIRSAIKSSDYKFPTTKIIVNLAPADIKKSWPSFDLPIALNILLNSWYIKKDDILKDSIIVWELSLDGSLRPVSSILPSVIWAMEKWFKNIILPIDNYTEASFIEWINIIPASNLKDLVSFLNKEKELIFPEKIQLNDIIQDNNSKNDFKYIIWQHQARRALEIARAWLHNIIMSGPPWSGKTMLARSFATILPELTKEEIIEVSKIYSISWLLNKENPLIIKRPFRTVHHTASSVSIIWWWRNAKPWEISLSHKWVLFFDEVLEFPKTVLELLRQPIEDWFISVNRVNWSYIYPAKFVFLWAMNPCPCWYMTDPDKKCICSQEQIKKYRSKLSWPMIDRIDIFIEVPKVKTDEFGTNNNYKNVEDSATIRERVQKAKDIQLSRFVWTKITSNSQMTVKEINEFCKLDTDCNNLMKNAIENFKLSARSYYRILKLARTIGDLEWVLDIKISHLREAISFKMWE